jgi:perosamine synthetase
MVTHIYGRTVDMDRVMEIANKHDLRVIEDACEAQGAHNQGKMIGSYDIGCFSFYMNKIIHGEEGGAITTNDSKLASKIRDMKSMSFGETHNYYHERIGFNYRMTNSQAALILESLKKAPKNIRKREEIKNKFNELFPDKYRTNDNRDVVWVYDLQHPKSEELVYLLKQSGIVARHSFKPMSSMPLFKSDLIGKNAKIKSEQIFYLHLDVNWSMEDVEKVFSKTISIMENL